MIGWKGKGGSGVGCVEFGTRPWIPPTIHLHPYAPFDIFFLAKSSWRGHISKPHIRFTLQLVGLAGTTAYSYKYILFIYFNFRRGKQTGKRNSSTFAIVVPERVQIEMYYSLVLWSVDYYYFFLVCVYCWCCCYLLRSAQSMHSTVYNALRVFIK